MPNIIPQVTRLNALLVDSPEKVREVEECLSAAGACEIGWSCLGRTRAEWQTASDAAWIATHRPTWRVEKHADYLIVRASGDER